MPTPPAQLPSTFASGSAVRAVRPGNRTAERLGLAAIAVFGVLGLAVWQIPPRLDWSRYKGAIAHYASARLGRHVAIGGQVRLTLLPRAMLLADNVTLSDRGDGISARLGTLRLEVSLSSLLGGHVVPRTLTLDNPVATMPWPLPRAASPGIRPTVAQAFSATMEGGTLQLGGLRLTGIEAVFQTDPDTGAFDAQGSAMVAGLPWRFTALIGAPGRDGIAPLTLTLDGQAPYGAPRGASLRGTGLRGTGGAFYGRILNDGTVAGRVTLRGPDLSQIGPAPAVKWQVQGAVTGDAFSLRAPALEVLLGDAPGHADLALHLAAPAAAKLRASFGHLPSGAWAWKLLQDAPEAAGRMQADLDLSASAVSVAGALIQAPRAVLSIGPAGAVVHTASAILPGGARLDASGAVRQGSGGFAGKLHLAAPDLRRTLQYLTAGATDTLPKPVLDQADVQGDILVVPGRIALTGLTGQADGARVAGSLAIGLGSRPALGIDLTLDQLAVADWLAWRRPDAPAAPGALGGLAQDFAGLDTEIHLHAGTAMLPGLPFRNAILDAHGGREGLSIHRLAADLPGLHVETSGNFGTDGAVAEGRFDLASPDAGALPAAWRQPPKLWQGPFHLALTAAGPPDDIAAQLRADLGDLRAEAEAHIDQAIPRANATITLRHPGAPRLLDALGLPHAEAWLDHGSLALLAHLILSPGHVQAQDFSLSAASLHAEGALDADLTGAVPVLTGRIAAGTLALPNLDLQAPLPWDFLRALNATLQLRADRVIGTLAPDATAASATLRAASGLVLIDDGQAEIAGGHAAFTLAGDATQTPPAIAVQAGLAGAAPDGLALPGHQLRGGTMDLTADFSARGFAPAALLASLGGDLTAAAHGVSVQNIDLPALTALLTARRPKLKPLLEAAMASGSTGGLDGTFRADAADGVFALGGRLVGASGALQLSGTADAGRRSLDLTLAALPAMLSAPALNLHVVSAGGTVQGQTDLGAALAWAGQAGALPGRPPHHPKKANLPENGSGK